MPRIVEYTDEYLPGVVACIKRNFKKKEKWSETTITGSLRPLVNYSWGPGHTPDKRVEYGRGMVLLDNDNAVVGFCGMIVSKQVINGEEYIYGSPTTTAIDPKYRIYVYSMFDLMHKVCDLVGAYTPSEVNRQIEEKLFKYKYIERLAYLFFPIPVFPNKAVKIKPITESSEIGQEDLREVYEDHKGYGIKCVCISADGKTCYLFYRIDRRTPLKLRFVRIFHTSDPALCGRYAKDIIWYLQKREKAFLRSDSRFLGGEQMNYKLPCLKKERSRLEKNFKNEEERFPYGLLYSELVFLKSKCELDV